MHGRMQFHSKRLFSSVHTPYMIVRTKRVFTVFGLTRSVFIESFYLLAFFGVEKEIQDTGCLFISLLRLVSP